MQDQMPLVKALSDYTQRSPLRMHMPGHKARLPWLDGHTIPLGWDVTEIPGMDNLYDPSGPIMEAQKLAAQAFGAKETCFLANGATAGIHAMLSAFCLPDQKVLLPRDCHQSVLYACALAGLDAVYIWPKWDEASGMTMGITPAMVAAAIHTNPDAHALCVTYPSYYGLACDLAGIKQVTGQAGVKLLVDQAHGAHFSFMPSGPLSASHWADAWVESAHKTLPALTPGAYLHLADPAMLSRTQQMLRAMQTTSPSYLVMASLDGARAWMQREGRAALQSIAQHCQSFDAQMETMGFVPLHRQADGGEWDATRLVIDLRSRNLSGYAAQALLSKQGIVVEMADSQRIVCIVTAMDALSDIERLQRAVLALPMGKQVQPIGRVSDIRPRRACSLREALFGPSMPVAIGKAYGRVSAGCIGIYPPGVPLYCPGEVIDRGGMEWLKEAASQNMDIVGMDHDRIQVMEM